MFEMLAGEKQSEMENKLFVSCTSEEVFRVEFSMLEGDITFGRIFPQENVDSGAESNPLLHVELK